MARIRSIKPEFWTSAQVMECSPNARLMFIGLWNFCDDHGRHPRSTKQIKALIFPGDDISSSTVQGMIDELVANGLMISYDVDGKGYLQVTGWHHQKIDKRQDPKYPPVPDVEPDLFGERSSNGIDGEEGRGEERKGEEKKEKREAALIANGSGHAPAKRGRRLSPDFQPTPTMRQHGKTRGLNDRQIDAEAAKMRDWSLSSPNGAKLDWEAAWRNWLSRANPPARAGPENGVYDRGL